MTDRDRLIELVDKAKEEYANDITNHTETDYIVETLLNRGVIAILQAENEKSILNLTSLQNDLTDLQAENERLKEDNKSLTFHIVPARGSGKSSVIKIKIDAIKSEAYKECIENIKEEYADLMKFGYADISVDGLFKKLDNLLKELEGDTK